MRRLKIKSIKSKYLRIREMQNLQPYDILNQCNQSPINIKNILKQMKINYSVANFSSLEKQLRLKGSDEILCISFAKGTNLKMLYSNKLNQCEINYVLAHELAHCCLHSPFSMFFHVEMRFGGNYYASKSMPLIQKIKEESLLKELEADEFAANLLIPTNSFIDCLESDSTQTTQDIAELFEVPVNLIYQKIDFITQMSQTLDISKESTHQESKTFTFKDDIDIVSNKQKLKESLISKNNDKFNMKDNSESNKLFNAPDIQSHHVKKYINKVENKNIPKFYRNISKITISLFFVGIVLLLIDLFFSLTRLNCSPYITLCLSCLSIYFTNRIALNEWKEENDYV